MSKQNSISKRTAIREAFRVFLFGEAGTAGAALVEATIIVPILVVMSIYIMDFGLLFYNMNEMQNAAQAGAQWAIANGTYNSSNIQVAAQNAMKLPASCVTVTSSEFCGCSDPNANPPVTQLASGACTGATNVANLTCNASGVAGNYVTVSASPTPTTTSGCPPTITTGSTTTYKSLIPYGLLSSPPSVSATATVRIQ